jgi:lipopolysaccharide biosynthesis regulator YciM
MYWKTEASGRKNCGLELYSKAVDQFLVSCNGDVATGSPISPDNIAKAAVLHCYRTCLEKDEAARARQGDKAIEWISRAILRDPLDPALQIKLADVYGMHERYDEAVSIFERLERDERLTSACKAMVRLLSSVYRWTRKRRDQAFAGFS